MYNIIMAFKILLYLDFGFWKNFLVNSLFFASIGKKSFLEESPLLGNWHASFCLFLKSKEKKSVTSRVYSHFIGMAAKKICQKIRKITTLETQIYS